MEKRKTIFVTIGAGLLGLLSGVTCCGFPALAAFLASVGIGTSFISALQPFQPYLIGIAIIGLAREFYKAYRPMPKQNCCGNRTKQRVLIWSISALLVGTLAYQNSLSQLDTEPQNSELTVTCSTSCGTTCQTPPPKVEACTSTCGNEETVTSNCQEECTINTVDQKTQM